MNNWYIRFMKFNENEICLSWREWGGGEPVLPGQRPPEQPRHPAPHPQLGARHQEDGQDHGRSCLLQVCLIYPIMNNLL